MIITLFFLNIMVFLSTILAVAMFMNNLKIINNSIDLYLDPKKYKPEVLVKFPTVLLKKYEDYKRDKFNEISIELLVKNCFYENKIGIFNTQKVETIANRGKELIWFITISMTLYEVIQRSPGKSKLNIILIGSSAVLGLIIIFIQLWTSIEMAKEKLFLKLQNYLQNEYPHYMRNKREVERTTQLVSKINELENQLEYLREKSQSKMDDKDVELEEKDIAYLIEKFSL